MTLPHPSALLILAALLAPASVHAQGPSDDPTAPTASPSFTLLGGIGNSMGWVGVSGEKYFGDGQYSILLGLGYVPETNNDGLSGPAAALATRYYLSGGARGLYGEFSLSLHAVENQLSFTPPDLVDVEETWAYGPGVLVGWQWVTRGGFTANVGIGVGYAPAIDDVPWTGLINLGLGYSWR